MDDKRNEMIFKILQKECEWSGKLGFGGEPELKICRAGGGVCNQKNCIPFKFALYLNRPEVRSRLDSYSF